MIRDDVLMIDQTTNNRANSNFITLGTNPATSSSPQAYRFFLDFSTPDYNGAQIISLFGLNAPSSARIIIQCQSNKMYLRQTYAGPRGTNPVIKCDRNRNTATIFNAINSECLNFWRISGDLFMGTDIMTAPNNNPYTSYR